MNRELQSFIMCLKDLKHRPKVPMDYYNVDISYANSTQEAQFLLEYYRGKGFTFINCTNPEYDRYVMSLIDKWDLTRIDLEEGGVYLVVT